MTWLNVEEYLRHRWLRICSVCRHNSVLSSFRGFSLNITFNNIIVTRVTLVEVTCLPSRRTWRHTGVICVCLTYLFFCVLNRGPFVACIITLFLFILAFSVRRLLASDYSFGILDFYFWPVSYAHHVRYGNDREI